MLRVPLSLHSSTSFRNADAHFTALTQIIQHIKYIIIYTNALLFNFVWNNRFTFVHADIFCFWICIGHLPERVLYNSRSISTNSQLQKNNVAVFILLQKFFIASSGFIPSNPFSGSSRFLFSVTINPCSLSIFSTNCSLS